jgi:hypothetical protein
MPGMVAVSGLCAMASHGVGSGFLQSCEMAEIGEDTG